MKGKVYPIARILIALAMVTGLFALVSQPAQAAAATALSCKLWHTVKYEETIVSIARHYDMSWRKVAELNSLVEPYKLYTGQKLCISGTIIPDKSTSPVPSGAVRVYAVLVKEDKTVQLQGVSLQPKAKYSVYLSRFKGYAPVEVKVGTVQVAANGTFSQEFKIPGSLKDVSKIRVRVSNGRGDSPENWFINANCQGNTGGYGAPRVRISIESVQQGDKVTIKAGNIPGNVTFLVYIGKPGSSLNRMEKTGYLRINDKKGGSITGKYTLPAKYSSLPELEIRLVNNPLEISAGKVFANKNK
jgi:hypothetical protein